MKHNIHLHSLFEKLNLEDIQVEDSSTLYDHANIERIRELTLDKVRKDRKEMSFSFKRQLCKVALVACAVLCIGGATVFAAANEGVRETISSLLGISQEKILKVGESIKNKNYKLTVLELACDSYTGIATISVDALSPKAKETFYKDNIVHKLRLSPVGYGLREEEVQDEYRRYFSFSFKVSKELNLYPEEGLTFSMEGISKKITIPITQTVELSELDIDIPASEGYPMSYQKLYYSDLGFTLLGTLENEDVNSENCLITIEFMDGSISKFYHYYGLLKEMTPDNEISAANTQTSINSSEKSVKNDTAPSDEDTIIDFDTEWFSGGGNSINSGKVLSVFSFSKKMDWSIVKSIMVNGTTVRLH